MTLKTLARPYFFVPLLLLAGTHLFYAKTIGAGFVTDFTGLQERLDGAPFSDFLTCFGFPAMHQATNFFLWLFYKWFGTQGLPWHLVFTSLHVLNGWLCYLFAKKIFAKSGFANPHLPALAASLLFAFSPYQAEVLVWKVSLGFLLCTAAGLASLLCWLSFLENGRRGQLFGALGFYLLALFSFELALAFPLLATVLAIWQRKRRSQSLTFTFLLSPFYYLTALYFLLNKIVLGAWVGHYGAAVHLKFAPQEMAGNLLKYFLKYLLFWREMPHGWKEKIILFCDKPVIGWLFLTALALLLTLVIYRIHKPFRKFETGLPWLLFFIALLPVSNLYVAWILHGENDRYGYLASMFFFMGLVAALSHLPKKLMVGLFIAWLGISLFFLHRTTVFWQNSARIFYSLLDDFRWQETEEVYVLAFPENYEGIPIFKDFSRQDLALKHALKYMAGKEAKGKFYQIAQFNMTTPTAGVSVQKDTSGQLIVTFNQWGNWWWRNGIGAGDHETETWKFQIEGNGSKVLIKRPKVGAVAIFSVGGKWMQVLDIM